jgi:precorrin-2 dehydrogenase / sirohydrochlorin ferrochelatase
MFGEPADGNLKTLAEQHILTERPDDRGPAMLPILLDLRGKRVLVVGGGSVGLRKAQAARAGGATVRLVAPEPPPAGWDPDEWRQGFYRDDHLDGMALAFAAATPEVNGRVVLDAIRRGIWVNSASDPSAGDFVVPAVVRRGELTIAVNTGGAAPALACRLREKLEAEYDGMFAVWIRLLETIRPLVRERIAEPERRRELLDGFADWPWLERLRNEGEDATWRRMVEALG